MIGWRLGTCHISSRHDIPYRELSSEIRDGAVLTPTVLQSDVNARESCVRVATVARPLITHDDAVQPPRRVGGKSSYSSCVPESLVGSGEALCVGALAPGDQGAGSRAFVREHEIGFSDREMGDPMTDSSVRLLDRDEGGATALKVFEDGQLNVPGFDDGFYAPDEYRDRPFECDTEIPRDALARVCIRDHGGV